MIKAGIIGATGYAGAELARLLLQRDDVEIVWYGSRSYVGEDFASIYRNTAHAVNEPCKDDDMAKLAEIADSIFTATPQGFCASQVTEDILSKGIPALIAVGLVALANLAAVRLYGEIEFWFAMIKVTTIIVMIVIGVGVIFFGFGNCGQAIGFGNLTEHGGFFAGGWKGFLTALCIVVASYQGVELIGITAGEAKNPQVTLRSAVGKVLWRILIFYVGAIFVIVTIFPWNEIGSNGSPFVLTFAKIGITAAAGIINFVVLTAALSGCNSGMYSCGRMLYALAKNRQLPAVVGKVSRHGVPVAGVAISIAILLIGSCLNYIIPNPQRVFVYVYSASVLPGMVPWFVILISQLRFRQAHKAAIASHPFRSILFPWANYLTMAFLICVLIGMYFNEDTRMSLFVGMGFLLAVTFIYKVFGLNRHGTAHKLRE